MIPERWAGGEIAIVGIGKSGHAAALLFAHAGAGARVYASDAGTSDEVADAARSLRAVGVHVDVGRHDLERIARAAVVVASPGIAPLAPPLERARAAGVPVVGEVEVALHFLPGTRYIAITGTNGKTTTTALTGALLCALGYDAVVAGNIGTPLATVALGRRHPRWVALEMSSFQLHDTPSLDPAVGVLTNLSPDHLDRYENVDAYYADKALMFRNASAASRWVVNYNDLGAMKMIARVRGEHHYFGTFGTESGLHNLQLADMCYVRGERGGAAAEEGTDAQGTQPGSHAGELRWHGRHVLYREELPLLGDHNVENAMAATLAVLVAEGDQAERPEALERIAQALRSFRPLRHRLEIVGEFDGVLWINDSKATNVSAARVAIQGMTRPTIVLLGGRHKGEPYTALAEPLRQHARAVLAYGESAPLIERDLADVLPLERLGTDFEAVVARARSLARPGDAVLLAPACSSFDMFANYEERGATFARLAAAGA
ncbi:MAG TPA: UDP-N-acetylmuramoyl-L-alanine--D-glutamate ligase [Gemmatimonadaceae bacterium]|nr:UDP-N-acetylmuramoyl-L-alanine--D-glutamate ligase [Gemmatimonadaceae bacterium]